MPRKPQAPSKSVSATIKSMAKAPAAKAPAPAPAPAAKAAPAASTEPFNWDTAEEEYGPATVAVYLRVAGPSRLDLEESTPAFVKTRVTAGFEATAKAPLKSGKIDPQYMVMDFKGNAARAEEFLKLAQRYARFREFTLRGVANPDSIVVTGPDGQPTKVSGIGMVRYAVKPLENRKAAKK